MRNCISTNRVSGILTLAALLTLMLVGVVLPANAQAPGDLVQSAGGENAHEPIVTFGQQPTEGNLLVAFSAHRRTWTNPNISGDGWNLVGNAPLNESGTWMAVWYKTAGPDEPTEIQSWWDEPQDREDRNATFTVNEYAGGGELGEMVLVDSASDQGDGVTSLTAGPTTSSTSDNTLVLGMVTTRGPGRGGDAENVENVNWPGSIETEFYFLGIGDDWPVELHVARLAGASAGPYEVTASWEQDSVTAMMQLLVFQPADDEIAEPEPLVWDFCDGPQGWFNANQSPVSWDGSRLVVNQADEDPGAYDPHISVADFSLDGLAYPHLAVKMTVENAPRDFTVGVFSFDIDDGAWRNAYRNQFNVPGNGEHVIRMDYTAGLAVLGIGNQDPYGTETINQFRFDIPDNEPAGAWPDFQDMVVTIDWVALTDDPDFEAGVCPMVVQITGPSMAVSGDDVTLWTDVSGTLGEVSYQWWKDGDELVGETNNYLELLSVTMDDAGVYAVEVTDDNDTVIQTHNLVVVGALPAGNHWTLFLGVAVLLLLGGLAILNPRKV